MQGVCASATVDRSGVWVCGLCVLCISVQSEISAGGYSGKSLSEMINDMKQLCIVWLFVITREFLWCIFNGKTTVVLQPRPWPAVKNHTANNKRCRYEQKIEKK